MAEDFVSVSHLTKRFGDLTVLSDISFSVRKGEFLCVVGPTGCGKTTFPARMGSIPVRFCWMGKKWT